MTNKEKKRLMYEKMCIRLWIGHEIEWINRIMGIMINEFGKPESFDDFKKRHPNFEEDVTNAPSFMLQGTSSADPPKSVFNKWR